MKTPRSIVDLVRENMQRNQQQMWARLRREDDDAFMQQQLQQRIENEVYNLLEDTYGYSFRDHKFRPLKGVTIVVYDRETTPPATKAKFIFSGEVSGWATVALDLENKTMQPNAVWTYGYDFSPAGTFQTSDPVEVFTALLPPQPKGRWL